MSRVSSTLTDVEFLQDMDPLITQLNVYATGGSGWAVGILTRLEIKTVSCSKVNAGSYIEKPPIFKPLNPSISNVVKKRDNFCFLYCVAAALFSFIRRANSPKTHKKTSSDCLSTQSYCQYLCPPFHFLKNGFVAQSMFIRWRTPSWCPCIIVRIEKGGTKLTFSAW